VAKYVPERGDVVWLHFDLSAGHEQAGHRPAFVISPRAYNAVSGIMLCCPMTTKIKGYPFEVEIVAPDGSKSAMLSDQVKSLDWVVRAAKFRFSADPAVFAEARAKIAVLFR
jgi:mRNA interferase MazF